MTIQYSTAIRNARLDAIEAGIGVSAVLKLRSGAKPANCAAADSGTVIATIQLPVDWMTNASAGVKSKTGTWEDTAADASGTIGHFRFYDSTGAVCGMQGSVSATGGGGDMTIDNTTVVTGQDIVVTAFGITGSGA